MIKFIRPSLVILTFYTIILGCVYPLSVTAIAQLFFSRHANGSVIKLDDSNVGSYLIGQSFISDLYFHGRPSATSMPDPNDSTKTIDAPYNATNSSGSNLGPTSKVLIDRINVLIKGRQSEDKISSDEVTTSASGLDPDISPNYALSQVKRVSIARNIAEDKLQKLVEDHIEGRILGVIGEPHINVLTLNIELDHISHK